MPQGETALTDHLLLEMARLDHPHVRVLKTPVSQEDKQGTDWEWWIGTPNAGWLRYATQAKRLTLSSGRYDQLAHEVGSRRQVDILRQYAAANHAIPAYCFYNHFSNVESGHWHCERQFDAPQLGCSIAPMETVDNALETRGGRSFDRIHRERFVVPWRCLVRCPRFIGSFVRDARIRSSASNDLETVFGVKPVVYPTLPESVRLAEEVSPIGNTQSPDREIEFYFDSQFYSANAEIYPRRIAVVDISESDDLGSVRMQSSDS